MVRTLRLNARRTWFSLAGLVVFSQTGYAQKIDLLKKEPADKLDILRNEEMIRKYTPIIPHIKASLKGDNPETKRAALAIITDIPEDIAKEAGLAQDLLDFLKTPGHTAELQALALKSFSRTIPEPADVRAVLQAAADSPDIRVKRAGVVTAANLLASASQKGKTILKASYFMKIADASLPTLGKAMEDEHAETQLAAQAGMTTIARLLIDVYTVEINPTVNREDLIADPDKWTSVAPVLKAIDAEFPRFKKGFASPEAKARRTQAVLVEMLTNVRRMALQSQGRDKVDPFPTGLKTILPVLDEQANDSSADVRLAIAEALEPLGDLENARAILIRKADDSSLYVRWTAARALGLAAPKEPKEGYTAEIAALTKLAGDKDTDVRLAALNGLQRYRGLASSATDTVLVAAKDGDVEARVVALATLTEIRSDADRTIPALIESLQDKDVRVQQAAAQALVRFGAKAKEALPYLRTIVVGDDADVRFAAAQAILAIEKPDDLKSK